MAANRAEVLVIGGGIVGVCAAYFLAQRGAKVVLLERDEICSGASYGNAGLVVPSHSIPLPAPGVVAKGLRWLLNPESPFYIRPRLDLTLLSWLWRFWRSCTEEHVRTSLPSLCTLQQASLALFAQFAAEGLPFGWQRKGTMTVYNTEQGFEDGVREVELLRQHGIAAEVLTGEQAREREPLLRETVVGGVYFPGDAHLDPAAFVHALANRTREMGALILTQTEVKALEGEGRRVERVLADGEWQVDLVVLAAGAWSPQLVRPLGIPLPIQPAKGYSITFCHPNFLPSLPLMLNEVRVAVTPLDGRLRLGGTLELAGLDLSINQRRIHAIRQGVAKYLPSVSGSKEVVWSGLRPCTPDGLPVLGRPHRLDNLIIATGHGTLGVSLGPVTGKLVAQMAAGEPLDHDVRLWSPDRFLR